MTQQVATSYGVGQYRSGEEHQLVADRMYPRNGTRRGILFRPGVGQAGRGVLGGTVKDKPLMLAAGGYPVLGASCCAPVYSDANWGNDDAIAAVGDAIAYLRSTFGASSAPVGLCGASMGVCVALAYARANPADVFAVAGFIPVLDIDYCYQRSSGLRATIAVAYGMGLSTIAAGSNGVNTSTFAGAGTLNVASAAAFPASGTVRVQTAGTYTQVVGLIAVRNYATVTYTGKGGTTLTGCTRTALTGGTGVMATGEDVWQRTLPSLVTHSAVEFGASDLAGLPVRLWTASNDNTASTTAVANAWDGAGSTLTVTDLGAVDHSALTVDPTQVLAFFDANGGRT